MTDTSPYASPFPTIPAGQLRVGDHIHRPAGRPAYVLVARTALIDDLVHLMVYDCEHPDGTPVSYRPEDRVLLACRDLIEPDDGQRAWTDASWRRAHRRGAAFALMDQIRARSVGMPPVTGVDAEIDRIRGRDPLPPRVVPVTALSDLLTAHHRDGYLVLDVDRAGVRAVLALFVALKDVEGCDGSWNGGNVVAIVAEWFARLGIDPDAAVDQLEGRIFTTGRAHDAGQHGRADAPIIQAIEPDPQPVAVADGFGVVDLDRVTELVRAQGIDCVIDTPGGGVAVLLAGAPTEEPVWAFGWAVQAGPGRFGWDEPSLASTRDLRVGPDTADRDSAVLVREVGAITEAQVAELVIAQVRRERLREVASSDRPARTAGSADADTRSGGVAG